jgi:hypothetical protein
MRCSKKCRTLERTNACPNCRTLQKGPIHVPATEGGTNASADNCGTLQNGPMHMRTHAEHYRRTNARVDNCRALNKGPMRVRATVEHYKRDQRMSANLKNILEGPNTSVDNRGTLLKKPVRVRETRRGQCVGGQLWNTTKNTEGTNARADNCRPACADNCRTLKNESMRVPANAYH